jgi:hypothetical protein
MIRIKNCFNAVGIFLQLTIHVISQAGKPHLRRSASMVCFKAALQAIPAGAFLIISRYFF